MNPSNPESGSSCSPDRYNKEAKAGVLQRKRKHSAITTESSRTPPPSIVITTTRDPIAVCPICNAYPCHHEKDINWTRTRMHDYWNMNKKWDARRDLVINKERRALFRTIYREYVVFNNKPHFAKKIPKCVRGVIRWIFPPPSKMEYYGDSHSSEANSITSSQL